MTHAERTHQSLCSSRRPLQERTAGTVKSLKSAGRRLHLCTDHSHAPKSIMQETEERKFDLYNVGETFTPLGLNIRNLIISSPDYIVFLDDDFNTQWKVERSFKHNETELGRILTHVSILEAKSDFILRPSRIQAMKRFFGCSSNQESVDPVFRRIRNLLGEAVARILDSDGTESADLALNAAASLISAKNAEYSRGRYYGYALPFSVAAGALALIIWVTKKWTIPVLGVTGFEISFCSMFGAIGAFAFAARRGERVDVDAIFSASIQWVEADARLSTGIVAAALVSLAIKTGLLFGAITGAEQLKFMVLASILAGYSERAIPNLAKKFGHIDVPNKPFNDNIAKSMGDSRGRCSVRLATDEKPKT